LKVNKQVGIDHSYNFSWLHYKVYEVEGYARKTKVIYFCFQICLYNSYSNLSYRLHIWSHSRVTILAKNNFSKTEILDSSTTIITFCKISWNFFLKGNERLPKRQQKVLIHKNLLAADQNKTILFIFTYLVIDGNKILAV